MSDSVDAMRDPEFLKRHQLYRRPYNYSLGLSTAKQLDVGLIFDHVSGEFGRRLLFFVQSLLTASRWKSTLSRLVAGISLCCRGLRKAGIWGRG